jgi:hypothetical protein
VSKLLPSGEIEGDLVARGDKAGEKEGDMAAWDSSSWEIGDLGRQEWLIYNKSLNHGNFFNF